jgi:hypothetical protein
MCGFPAEMGIETTSGTRERYRGATVDHEVSTTASW